MKKTNTFTTISINYQGKLPVDAVWHGGKQGSLPEGGTWHGGKQGSLPEGGTWHGGIPT